MAIEEEVATHRKWQGGDYRSYLEWMRDTIRIHQKYGLTERVFNSLIESAQYNPGVEQTLKSVKRDQYEIVLISGGFRELAARAQRLFSIQHAFAACEYFFGENGQLTGFNLLPCDFEGKIDFIRLMIREYGLSDEDWIFVGDGANDVPIAKVAPVSVAYSAHPDLIKVSTFRITDFTELSTILSSKLL